MKQHGSRATWARSIYGGGIGLVLGAALGAGVGAPFGQLVLGAYLGGWLGLTFGAAMAQPGSPNHAR